MPFFREKVKSSSWLLWLSVILNLMPSATKVFRLQLQSSIIGDADLLWRMRLNPLLESNLIRGLVLVRNMVV